MNVVFGHDVDMLFDKMALVPGNQWAPGELGTLTLLAMALVLVMDEECRFLRPYSNAAFFTSPRAKHIPYKQ